ncbi:MAG TPA: GNAT family N-acetyltransferase [Gemmatimonadaceae bacterium]|nr:GNAT family N-acetyltransferase [Gemmatimonadaceae bacterium]
MGLIIRRATTADADLLTALAHKIFLDTFGAQNTQKDIDIHVERTYGHDIQMRELTDPALTYLIAEVDGEAAGFAMIGEAKSESCMAHDAPIELFRFYVDKAWHGKGIAQPMMQACEAEARARGGKTICLSVWLENPRAIRFYEKTGFHTAGTQPYILGDDLQTDWVMVKDITTNIGDTRAE